MRNQFLRTVQKLIAPPTDPFFDQTTLLLHGDGTNGAQNNTFLDSSTNNFTITRSGNTTQGSFSPFSNEPTAWSNYTGTTTASIDVPAGNLLDVGTGDITIEGWVNFQQLSLFNAVFGPSSQNFQIDFRSSNKLYVFINDTGTSGTGTTSITTGTWNHFAIVRRSGVVYGYLNGVQEFSFANTTNFAQTDTAKLMSYSTGANYSFGYLSNFRIVKGTAVYTGNFTPPTAPLTAISGTSLLTCQSNRFVDNSANNFTITRNGDVQVRPFGPFNPTSAYSTTTVGGSGYFVGNNTNYLSVPASTNFLLTGNFTIECFTYVPSNVTQTTYSTIYGGAASVNAGLFSSFSDNNNFTFFVETLSINIGTGIKANDGAWHHVAAVRNSGVITMYIDGIARGTPATYSGNIDFGSASAGRIGAAANGNSDNPFQGYISNLRLVNGTALYTANFTPPTAPLTPVTNTQLMLNFTNAGIFDNTARNDLETVDNAQISTSVKKYGTGSLYFDGTGDGLLLPASPDLAFGLGNFTIECWIYLPSTQTSTAVLFDSRIDNPSVTGSSIEWSYRWSAGDNAYVGWLTTPSNNMIITFTAVLSRDTWHFVTLVRSAGTFIIFHNGSSVGSYGPVSYNLLAGRTRIGYGDAGTMNGYIDDYRITKGVARYTGTFTPPTAAFPNQ